MLPLLAVTPRCARVSSYWPILLLTMRACWGHLVLTYPPARKFPLDYLDNVRSSPPCGMPRDPELTQFTELEAGSSLQVSWDLAYPSKGGAFMELRNPDNQLVYRYPPVGVILPDDIYQLSYPIQLPPEGCPNCTLRLVRQDLDWGEGREFWSCSDVNIVNRSWTGSERCSRRGMWGGTTCISCGRLYTGSSCQFQNDCDEDSDCSNQGQCIDTHASRYPRRQCFCMPGWFGRHCEKQSPVSRKQDIQLELFQHKNLSSDFSLYFRILQSSQELEVVLRASSVTWLALGWRSLDANKTCQNFPSLGSLLQETTSSVTDMPKTHDNTPMVSSNTCDGSCGPAEGCWFNVSWVYEPSFGRVNFSVAARLSSSQYFGLGFSLDRLMPDSDIVVGWIRPDGSVYLSDRWAIGRMLPVEDRQNDLTLVRAERVDDLTKLTFSRPLATFVPSDQALDDPSCLYLLTARGSQNGDGNIFKHDEKMASFSKFCFTNCLVVTSQTPSTPRGVEEQANVGIVGGPSTEPQPTSNPCDGSCDANSGCIHDVTWKHDPQTQRVNFTVMTSLGTDEYFGLGFSEDQNMPNSDIVVGWIRSDGSTYLSDRWASAYQTPEEDVKNDLVLISGQLQNGFTVVSFSRPLDSEDSRDLALNVPQCVFFLTSKGPKSGDGVFSKHFQARVSTNKFCFSQCPVPTTVREPTTSQDRQEGGSTREPSDDTGSHEHGGLHPMDCIDIVVGSAKGDLTRVGDYYTRDRSTPLADEIYGGSDDLTAAFGFEEDGVTTILFRRKLTSNDSADWSIVKGQMHVVWAKGQLDIDAYHNPPSAFETSLTSVKNFYEPDVLKYHGAHNDHRGETTISFYDNDTISENTEESNSTNTVSSEPTLNSLYIMELNSTITVSTSEPTLNSLYIMELNSTITVSTSEPTLNSLYTMELNSTPQSSTPTLVVDSASTHATTFVPINYITPVSLNAPQLSTENATVAQFTTTIDSSLSTTMSPYFYQGTSSISAMNTSAPNISDMSHINVTLQPSSYQTIMLSSYYISSLSNSSSDSETFTHTLSSPTNETTVALHYHVSSLKLNENSASSTLSTFSNDMYFTTTSTVVVASVVPSGVIPIASIDPTTSSTASSEPPTLVSEVAGSPTSSESTTGMSQTRTESTSTSESTTGTSNTETEGTSTSESSTDSTLRSDDVVTPKTGDVVTSSSISDSTTPWNEPGVRLSTSSAPTSTSLDATILFLGEIRVTNLNYSEEFASLNSTGAQKVKTQIDDELNRRLKQQIDSLERANVTGFKPGSLIIEIEIRIMGVKEEDVANVTQKVESSMRHIVNGSSLAGFDLDHNYLFIRRPHTESQTQGNTGGGLSSGEVAIVAIAVILAVIAVTLIGCKLWRRRKSKAYAHQVTRNSSSSESQNGSNSGAITLNFMESSKVGGKQLTGESKSNVYQNSAFENHGFEDKQQGNKQQGSRASIS